MTSFYYYSITDLDDNTEYDSSNILAVDGEKIHEFGRRVLRENGMAERTAVIYPFGGDSKACAPSKEVVSFFPNSGIEGKPFVVHLKAQQQSDAALRQLLPFIDVLPDLLREVNLTRKIRLNPWERESARTTGSKRSDKFRKKVISYYRCASQSKKSVKCQVLDILTPIEEAQDKIIAAHIWKASTRGKGLEEFGLEENDVNSPRNGLFLTKGIEDAFDRQQVCFLYNILESKLVLWVADSNIMAETIEGSTMKFSDVHQRPLICPANCLPYRRLLSWHARLTLERRKESIQVENFTNEYDNSPGRRASKDDPIAYAINSMVEPGDDASVKRE